MTPDSLDGLIARHKGARPNPTENPAWANCEHDMGVLIAALERLREERDAALVDARRYRWLRPRLEIRNERSLAGSSRPALGVCVGWSYMDSKGPISSSRNFNSAGESLDAAIDAALSDEPKDGAATAEVKAFIEGLEGGK